jgi:hypothetical protein
MAEAGIVPIGAPTSRLRAKTEEFISNQNAIIRFDINLGQRERYRKQRQQREKAL